MSERPTPLGDDFIVIDLSAGIAGAYSTKLLADGGARVIKVEDPAGDPLRRRSVLNRTAADIGDGVLFQFLSTSKSSVVADADNPEDRAFVQSLLEGAHAVVWSAGSAISARPELRPGSRGAPAACGGRGFR